MARYARQALVILVVLGTILVAPTWETLFAATVAVILHLAYDTLALAAIALNYDLILQRWALRLLRQG